LKKAYASEEGRGESGAAVEHYDTGFLPGRIASGFSDREERAVDLDTAVPVLLEPRI
jgi:hypothetical protein